MQDKFCGNLCHYNLNLKTNKQTKTEQNKTKIPQKCFLN